MPPIPPPSCLDNVCWSGGVSAGTKEEPGRGFRRAKGVGIRVSEGGCVTWKGPGASALTVMWRSPSLPANTYTYKTTTLGQPLLG